LERWILVFFTFRGHSRSRRCSSGSRRLAVCVCFFFRAIRLHQFSNVFKLFLGAFICGKGSNVVDKGPQISKNLARYANQPYFFGV
jgi:hypothetical protein